MKIRDVQFVKSAPNWGTLPEDGRTEIAFVGRSNVGKSSLFNYLVGRRALAHTGQRPGKTTSLNYYLVNADSEGNGGFYLVDLPGFGYAKVSQKERARWQQLIGRYVSEREELRVVFHLIDSRHPPTKMDEELLAILLAGNTPYVIALTKADKLSRNQQQNRVRDLERYLAERGIEVPVVLTSAEKKEGADDLWRWASLLADL
jgi:GTP-binding protein